MSSNEVISPVEKESGETAPDKKKSALKTIAIVIAVIALFYLVIKFTGLGQYFTLTNLKATMKDWGLWGMLLFIALNCAAVLMHIPGMVFIFAAVLVYDLKFGIPIGYAGALLSAMTSFVFYRTVGGMSLQHLEKPFIQKMLSRIDSKPVLTTIIIRTFFGVAPPVNSGLALTNITFRHFMIGSSIGLVAPVLILSFLIFYFEEYALRWFS